MAVHHSFCILQKAARWLTVATMLFLLLREKNKLCWGRAAMLTFKPSRTVWMKCSEALMRWSLNASRRFWLKFACVHLLAGSLDVSATVCIWIPSSDLSQCLCLVAAGQCTCAGLWPCLLLPYKARVPLDIEGSEVRPSIIQGSLPHSNPVAEVHGVARRHPQLSTRHPAASTSPHTQPTETCSS